MVFFSEVLKPESRQVVFAKRSGNAVRSVYDVRDLHEYLNARDKGGGIVLIPGGGDGGRGRELTAEEGVSEDLADQMGRVQIIKNALLLASNLDKAGIDHQIVLPPTLSYEDGNGVYRVEPYSSKAIYEYHNDGIVPVVAGGDGQNGQTTDASVLTIAGDYLTEYPDHEAIALKTTKHNGVFAGDPGLSTDVPRFSRISADVMGHDPELNGALDSRCMDLLMRGAGVDLRVYSVGEHSMLDAVTKDVGTLVLTHPANGVAEFA